MLLKRDEMTLFHPCNKCQRKHRFPNYSCKTCRDAYNSNFKKDKKFDHKYQQRLARRKSDEKLRTLYTRIKEAYFGSNFIPDASKVTFEWQRRRGGICWKQSRKIRINRDYKTAFCSIPNDGIERNGTLALIQHKQEGLTRLMIHEAIHLRLNHHRKSFRVKEQEMYDKFNPSDVKFLFDGLTKQSGGAV